VSVPHGKVKRIGAENGRKAVLNIAQRVNCYRLFDKNSYFLAEKRIL
jgi:hypothetical protein